MASDQGRQTTVSAAVNQAMQGRVLHIAEDALRVIEFAVVQISERCDGLCIVDLSLIHI